MGFEKRRCKKCLACVALLVVFQIAVITAFALTVMKMKSPKVRLNAVEVESFFSMEVENLDSVKNTTWLSMSLLAQIAVRNSNFGHFNYDESTLVVLYDGVTLGKSVIPEGRARAKKTNKLEISVDVRTDRLSGSKGDSMLRDINSGILKLSGHAKLDGKVHLMEAIKKKKYGELNCDWSVNIATKMVENLICN